ncbi:MAG TPA: ABC transporter ATP-binding protein, partial [Acidimicrobiales bacterium]|nr:ABC transporter ATP-binding protein [Acidimicrobiales bacterium]
WSALVAGAWVIFGAALTAALVVMGHEATKGAVSAGALVVVITLAMQLSTSMGTLAFSMSEVGGAMQAADRLQWLRRYSSVDHEGLRDGSQDGPAPVTRQALPEAISDGIRLDGVCFRYSDKGPNVLSDVDLLLPAGATIAIVGENGAGKSTLVKLLLRLYPPSAGRIFIDGVDLEATDPAEWRSRTSAGFQDFARFEFTLQQAVAIGSLEQLDDPPAARHALTQAGGQDLLQVLDDGLSTQLGRKMDDGVELSGGQWQKVALGRSMMRQTPLLLVLDEPTAALDALSEAALFDRYALAARSASRGSGAVTVLVSHRYSTVRSADLIVVLQHGKVCEMGTHHQLMKANKVYAELYRTQAAAYR